MTITQAIQGVLRTEALECPSVGLCYNLNQLGLLTNKCQAFCVLYPHVYVLALGQLFFWSFSLGGQFRFLDGRTSASAASPFSLYSHSILFHVIKSIAKYAIDCFLFLPFILHCVYWNSSNSNQKDHNYHICRKYYSTTCQSKNHKQNS